MYQDLIRQMNKQLGQLDQWLGTAATHAKSKSYDANVFLPLRLAPDQLPFAFQVQTACDTVKLAASRLAGKDAPKHTDDEKTIDQLRERVQSVIAYLDGFSAKDFEGAGKRVITQSRWEGKVMSGHDYLLEYALPNFYFHVTQTYALLRHNGVGLGKRDFLGTLTMTTPS